MFVFILWSVDFLGGSAAKNPPTNAGDVDSVPGWGRSSGEGNGNPFQYSCLRNPMDREAWWATVHGVSMQLNNKTTTATTRLFNCPNCTEF